MNSPFPFLYALFHRTSSCFLILVYRKLTFTCLCNLSDAFHPIRREIILIKIFKALKNFSKTKLDHEIRFINTTDNIVYSLNIVQSVITYKI